ncbi:hypothetical protein K4K54_002426 [Colletotrichum sp. SAR 10_86]|nr:hypothetical protein K4K54_002426 [Colletotrichum sp. SAR 10_86]
MSSDNEEHAIVIGIDFGTTFSGVSWAYSGQPNDIEVITRWEAQLNFASDTEKTPTAILYHGKQGAATWGHGIPPEDADSALKWFKLLLVDEKDLPDNIRHSSQIAKARELIAHCNKDPVDVISGYLRRLWNHSIECIGIAAGNDLIQMCKFHIVITLPAIWPDYAKSRMRRAAKDAGLLEKRPAGHTTLTFISEPEAAALATLRDLSGRPNIKAGDHFVVCDAGGGTVDLISYEVTSMKPMVVREAIRGDGELCGGVFLDEAFVDLIKEKVTSDAWSNVPKDEAAKLLNGDWEHGIKQQFEGQERDWHMKLPSECQAKSTPQRGIKRKRNLILTCDDLRPAFDKISEKIASLVQKQIDGVLLKSGKLPKNVILVGGFGRCRYLRSYLRSNIDESINLMQSTGTKPWTAICRGASIHGLTQQSLTDGFSVSVKSRIARVSYGVAMSVKFDPKKHLAEDKFWCDVAQRYMAGSQMEWFLEQGTDISTAEPVRRDYVCRYATPPDDITDTLEMCTSLPLPSRYDDTVKELCTISWSKKIDFESLPRYVNRLGKVYHELEYTIEMNCAGASVDFSVIHDGKQVGAKNVSVVYEEA